MSGRVGSRGSNCTSIIQKGAEPVNTELTLNIQLHSCSLKHCSPPENTYGTSGSSDARNQALVNIFPPAYHKAIPAPRAQLILGDTCGPAQFQIFTITRNPFLTIYLFYIPRNICQICNLLCFSSTPTSRRYDT